MNFHIKNWFRIGRNVSWRLSRYSLSTLLYFFPPFKSERRFRTVRRKHEYIFSYLDPIYRDILSSYKDNMEDLVESEEKNIWVFWDKGLENAPPVVRLCIESMKKHSNGATVHLLTRENLKEYLEIPGFIMEKYEKGYMTLAFLTDYMRISLLEKYGGLWLDATVLVSHDIPGDIFKKKLFSLHTPYEKTIFVNDNRIHCYVLGGRKGYSFFTYVRTAVEKYWKDHDFMIDYYLIDYTIMYAYYNNDEIRKAIDSFEYTSPSLYELVPLLNKPLEKKRVDKLLEENLFSKLNWRVEIQDREGTVFQYLKTR